MMLPSLVSAVCVLGADGYSASMQPFVSKYCLECHSTAAKKGSLDLERFKSSAQIGADVKVWQQAIEMLEAAEMPPKDKPQPTSAERKAAIAWVRNFLDREARSRKNDPGPAPLRRLSNAEYEYTIRDLTGLSLKSINELPPDGAGGEGFTNAAEALSDVPPALFAKYLGVAKELSEHLVLLPDGFRFSKGKTRRDWTDESVERLRKFYRQFTPDGALPIKPYVSAAIKHRAALLKESNTAGVANREKINDTYFGHFWRAMTNPTGAPLRTIGRRVLSASEKDVDSIVAEVAAHQQRLWKVVPVGSYRDNATSRQVPDDSKAQTAAAKRGFAEFRAVFPLFICHQNVIPTDEAVCLKMYHREDEPLFRLFLVESPGQAIIDELWEEHRFISRQPIAENDYLPQFIGFVTQDQPKELLEFFEGQRPAFKKRADDFRSELESAAPTQLRSLIGFAGRAFRRPLKEEENNRFGKLYRDLRGKPMDHEETMQALIVRVFTSPAFLFRSETIASDSGPRPLDDWELASRLSYFLWSSLPDGELRDLAKNGRLNDPENLVKQLPWMLKFHPIRRLAVEFGTQWLHVRDFAAFNEKNERLFPTFNADLRKAMDEEAILFFEDFFVNNRKVSDLLDADRAFLNETLAKHYGIPNVKGPEFRLVTGVRQFGRGGVLGFGSVLAKQSAASRTSPVLRGNWVVETLLGEKLPRPPANVPQLPEVENANGMTMRQQVERHAKVADCAVCHVRIDPYGFSLEHFDAVGRWRDKDQTGLAIDAHAKLKDGTEFVGVDGLRNYLLTKKRDVFVRLFCKRLLGYALGRSVQLSDTSLLDEMVAELDKNDGRVWAAIRVIVRSPQFRMKRGVVE